jgi:hypothetical protein
LQLFRAVADSDNRIFCQKNFRTTTVSRSEDFCHFALLFKRTSTNHLFS